MLFEQQIVEVGGLRPLPRDPRVTSPTVYQCIVRYDAEAFKGVPRDHALAALQAEGLPCFGRFYVPLPDDPLFAEDPVTNAAARAGASWKGQTFPVAARAAYQESIWLPHELFLGGADDVHDIVACFAKLRENAEALRQRPPQAPGGRR